MPNGTQYAGRFNLEGDLFWAKAYHDIDIMDPKTMAKFYDVSLEEYIAGQEWEKVNLPKLRSEEGQENRNDEVGKFQMVGVEI